MSAWGAAAAAASVGGVALVSGRLASTAVSGPMVLVAVGVASGPVGLDLIDISRDAEAVRLLLEAALVTVLCTLLAVILAPTDAALGQPAIADPRVPGTVRQTLDVESGLNDGIALPFFVVLLGTAVGHGEGAGAG